nr:FAD-dependent oxidoreductase [Burkholderiaceae bacterium]
QVLQAWKDLPIRFVGGVKVANVERLALNAERLWHPQPAGTACAGQTTRLRITTECGQHFAADEVIVAAGLQTPSRLARSANLAWADGIAVDPHTLRTSDERIHAMGDCVTLDGQASRFIEPIFRQATTIAATITACAPVPYEVRPTIVRVKTTSLPLTLH